MRIKIPELSLIVLIGASGSGKSTFAKKHFKSTEILSSDYCRALISDDECNQFVTKEAFEVLHFIVAKRLAAGKLTVIDATSVKTEDRKPLLALAREYHVLPAAIVFNIPEKICHERNKQRSDRNFGPHVIRYQRGELRRSLRYIKREGFKNITIFDAVEKIDAIEIKRTPLWNNLKHEHGPFDIIGDVHGCFDELTELLEKLGYVIHTASQSQEKNQLNQSQENNKSTNHIDKENLEVCKSSPKRKLKKISVTHPKNRKMIFLGDLVDRGPKTPEVLQLVMNMVTAGIAFCIPGNHDVKLMRKLKGKNVKLIHGLAESVQQLEKLPPEFHQQTLEFIDSLVSHYQLDGGKLVVAHAGMNEKLQGRASGKVREFALYGETTGETDQFGLPVRYNWAADYRGQATVVYGHTPVLEAEWLNNTICIDTGCVFGGQLTALRYPERELVSIPAKQIYYESVKPFSPHKKLTISSQQELDEVLDAEDVTGKRFISTRLNINVTIQANNATAALEVMSRFAVNPKWLIYLPPTMSPSDTSKLPKLLEYPTEAFDYYRKSNIEKVICEEKHMGSRTIVIVCRDEGVAQKRFGIKNEGIGICYTRTGRRFFTDTSLETAFLTKIQLALEKSDFWTELKTDWVCLDCELMPWSTKAQSLIRQQYAAVGAASRAALPEAVTVLQQAQARGVETTALIQDYQTRLEMVTQYVDAYRSYCWPVNNINDLKLAPFHILATEGQVHSDKNHIWHIETLAQLCKYDKDILMATSYKIVKLSHQESEEKGIAWWQALTEKGGEGMVIKPFDFINKGKRGWIQPALKCRGREYLRIIYGPEYTASKNLERLRARGLSTKRSLALREFALGIEALERFVQKEPLRRVHECVFGVLALESEPVDPRL
ncbi:polynucleotide kinase-phosphatase [Candidatus Parabeggiatoa sp. HSG14]|uniref:polynucleotide kinase-phosphatase n=1 Tax=Candidatus Parabeggiatoa sp. HSG14 TaxID=3055593 RepID=UPI0025A735A2|nr:polynucleotide kinase-phosphatase [Thiotrichales bacterium HSG14]